MDSPHSSITIPDASTSTSLPTRWRPKLTSYRLLVIFTTLAFLLAKALLGYQGRTIVPITLEWLFSTVVFLLFFTLDTYQRTAEKPAYPGFFEVDLIYFTRRHFSGLDEVYDSAFDVAEVDTRKNTDNTKMHPPIRGFDLLVMSTTIGFGMSKSAIAYAGRNTDVTTVEWIGAAVIGVGLYWLGLYDNNPTHLMPYLFETDYSQDVRTAVRVVPQLVIASFAGWWSYQCLRWIILLSHSFDAAQIPDTFVERAIAKIILPGFSLLGFSMTVATFSVIIIAIVVVVVWKFQVRLFGNNVQFLWDYVSRLLIAAWINLIILPFFLSGLLVFLSGITSLQSHKNEAPISSFMFTICLILVWIACLGFWTWLFNRLSLRYLRSVARELKNVVQEKYLYEMYGVTTE